MKKLVTLTAVLFALIVPTASAWTYTNEVLLPSAWTALPDNNNLTCWLSGPGCPVQFRWVDGVGHDTSIRIVNGNGTEVSRARIPAGDSRPYYIGTRSFGQQFRIQGYSINGGFAKRQDYIWTF